MPRIRTIKPEFPQSESMGRVSREARLCFVLLWTIADDAGRFRANSRMLASLLYPYDDDVPSLIDSWLDELERERCIRRYRADDATYAEIVKWLEHQKIDRPSKSRIPSFDESSRGIEKDREASATDLGPSTLDLGPGPVARARRAFVNADFQRFYGAYPHKVGRAAADKAFAKAITKANLDAIMAGLERYVRTKPPDRPWCNPATWLNQERWADSEAPTSITPKESGYVRKPYRPPPGTVNREAVEAELERRDLPAAREA